MFARMLACIVLALLVSLTALAQDATKPSDDQSKTKAVTGCLQKATRPTCFPSPVRTARVGTCAVAPLNSPTMSVTK
jgi:hypothetical protein